eukprot:5758434-Prymnesium_polylepis.2
MRRDCPNRRWRTTYEGEVSGAAHDLRGRGRGAVRGEERAQRATLGSAYAGARAAPVGRRCGRNA